MSRFSYLFKKYSQLTLKQARRLIILITGLTIILFGVILVFIPGPAIIVIPLGLLVLATEFRWAKRFLRRIRKKRKK